MIKLYIRELNKHQSILLHKQHHTAVTLFWYVPVSSTHNPDNINDWQLVPEEARSSMVLLVRQHGLVLVTWCNVELLRILVQMMKYRAFFVFYALEQIRIGDHLHDVQQI
jgi:hypothetical protein